MTKEDKKMITEKNPAVPVFICPDCRNKFIYKEQYDFHIKFIECWERGE